MNDRRTEARAHTVLAIDADKRVVEERTEVPDAEVAPLVRTLQARLGADVRILVDGVALDTQLRPRERWCGAPEARSRAVGRRKSVVIAQQCGLWS